MAKPILRYSDPWSATVLIATLALFIVALFLKGFSHDLLLEAGVFLVSLKLILMARKIAMNNERTDLELHQIEDLVKSSGLELHQIENLLKSSDLELHQIEDILKAIDERLGKGRAA